MTQLYTSTVHTHIQTSCHCACGQDELLFSSLAGNAGIMLMQQPGERESGTAESVWAIKLLVRVISCIQMSSFSPLYTSLRLRPRRNQFKCIREILKPIQGEKENWHAITLLKCCSDTCSSDSHSTVQCESQMAKYHYCMSRPLW